MSEIVLGNVDCRSIPLEVIERAHAMITDPPYSRHVHENITSAGTAGDKSRGWHRQDLAFGALTPALRHYIARCAARVSGWSLIFSDIESAHVWRFALKAAAAEFVRTIPTKPTAEERIAMPGLFGPGDDPEADDDPGYAFACPWVRWSQPQKSGDRPTQGAELVTHAWGARAKRKSWNGPGDLVSYEAKALRGAEKHRTQKPLDLLLEMVSWYSNPGETVFDPCAGAGTTGLACRLLGRDFWGCELDPEWHGKASARLAGELSKTDRVAVARFLEKTRREARELLAKPRTKHPQTGKYTDEKTRARAERRLADADTCERNAA
jgi:hypothetical protein